MRKKLLYLMTALLAFNAFSQTTYTFNGDGDWTDTANWDSYPGLTVAADDIVEIIGLLTIPASTTVTNNGIIESYNTFSGSPDVTILGVLVNNNTIEFSNTGIIIGIDGAILANDGSTIDTSNSPLKNSGEVTISDGAVMNISGFSEAFINDVNGTVDNKGTIEIISGTFENNSTENNSIFNSGTFKNSGGSFDNYGHFNNTDTGIFIAERSCENLLGGTIDNHGELTISDFSVTLVNSGTLNNFKTIYIEDYNTLNIASDGTFINKITGTVEVSSEGKISNNSYSVEFLTEGKILNAGTIDNNNTVTISATGEIENNGDINNNFGGDLEIFGTLSGINTGDAGSFSNAGILAPGNLNDATGFYKFDSFFTSYVQTANGSINIELGGTVEGDTYDQVIVDDDLTLDGTLNVSLVNGFEPAIGDVFTVLTQGGNISGTFATVNLPTLPAGKKWDVVTYDSSNGVSLTILDSSLGLSEANDALTFNVYPNPTANELNVSGLSTVSNGTIFDLNGRALLTVELSAINSRIDLTRLPAGVYLLNIDGSSLKFVKN
ncbi:T9SS type A sorting domain-containing protein [Tamlana sp. 2_MG-2023]|uniref:T9SS type A sorting domain-containing protein n=1 Tax=unclassified Tamlana TaxID=2614803 RepID=UPI0026E14895|nr:MULTISPECIES: T9SS type A sorting domain-containing protein [unclassified Tamlana]MDO6759230.1 T9SS type A sorting domain-containing protein [Tamlana sp. 2_MG-2023]MDO6790631.1 T9SS type A sorting domain-containing protein [Tamlana sp. 1_MG-2023]